jgi:NAD+ synthetase
MRDGFIKVSAVSPKVRVADCEYNARQIIEHINKESSEGAKIIVFPELAVTAYTCGDLFFQTALLDEAMESLKTVIESTKDKEVLVFVGFPFRYKAKLYNAAAVINAGKLIAVVPKTFIPNYNEFYEGRYFVSARGMENTWLDIFGTKVLFGTKIIMSPESYPELKVSAEICEDLWAANAPSINHALAGANVIVNLSASDEIVSKSEYRLSMVATQSAKLYAGYIYASAGEGESTGDLVFSAHNIIAENGSVLAQSPKFKANAVRTEFDIQKLNTLRQKSNTFVLEDEGYTCLDFLINIERTELTRHMDVNPFIPTLPEEQSTHFEEIYNIQAYALKKRLEHTNVKNVVIGISGGLDSTLALISVTKAFDLLGLDRRGIKALTLPAFGTTDRTYKNACDLTLALGAELKEINISRAVSGHLQDIGHSADEHDTTYENAQARERTQVLMDYANKVNGFVIGTGDLSELALGWATYNGDHMSMYAVNASIPKTLVRYMIRYYADMSCDEIKSILYDILDTPVSPELLPPVDGKISQKTEDLVGPYELHDFFLYNMLKFGYSPKKVYRLALIAFKGVYDREYILKWLKSFYRRFFTQQFKRSCMPDGPKVGTVCLSPRGDLRMPSDACMNVWINDLESMDDKFYCE